MCQQVVVSVAQSKDEKEKGQVAEFEYTLPEYFRGFEDMLNKHFKLAERGVNVRTEAIASIAFFVSCIYVLPVVPANLKLVSFVVEIAVKSKLLTKSNISFCVIGWL